MSRKLALESLSLPKESIISLICYQFSQRILVKFSTVAHLSKAVAFKFRVKVMDGIQKELSMNILEFDLNP